MVQAILTDIEGTTSAISFVHEVLFPYAAERLEAYVIRHGDEPPVRAIVDAVRLELERPGASHEEVIAALLTWIREDRKVTPLKELQGMIWAEGYDSGALQSHMYPDAVACLRTWKERGLEIYVYSSGSIRAQRLLFGHTGYGDLTGLFSGYFDTTTGPKKEAGSYRKIAEVVGIAPERILFLSDAQAELEAASAAGLQTCGVEREGVVLSWPDRVSSFVDIDPFRG